MATTAMNGGDRQTQAGEARVLLVEDQDDHAELIARAFRRHTGWAPLVVARTLAEARRQLAAAPCDLVITDFLLPDGRGIELLPGDRDEVALPYMVMTSHGDEQLAVDAMKAGAMDYIVKSDEMFRALPRMCERVLREWRLIWERKESDRKLRLNEHMVSATSDLLVYVDRHYIVRSANQRYLDAMHVDEEKVVGQHSAAILGSEHFDESIRPQVDRALHGERHVIQAWRSYPGLGTRFMDIEYSPYLGADGQVEGVVMRGRDMTGMRKAVDALRVSESRLRTIIDSAPECVKTVSADGTVVEMNPAGVSLMALSDAREVCGKSLFDLVEPQYAAPLRALHARVMNGETGKLEFAIADATGRKLWLETHAAPLRDEAGAIAAMLSVTRDFTERRRIEQELRASETRFRGLFETVPVGVYQTAPDGTMTTANLVLCAMLGYESAAGLAEHVRVADFFAGPEDWRDVIGRLATDGVLSALECRLRKRDGSTLDVLVSVRSIMDRDNSVDHYEGTVTDITELTRARHLLTVELDALRAIASGQPVDVTLTKLCTDFAGVEPESGCCVLDTGGDQPGVRVAPGVPAEGRALLDRHAASTSKRYAGETSHGNSEDISVISFADEPLWQTAGGWLGCWEMPLRTVDGALLGVVAVLRRTQCPPNTGQRRALAALAYVCGIALAQDRQRQQQAALMTILEATPDIVAMLDVRGKPFYMNRAGLEQLGIARDELDAVELDDLHPTAVAHMVRAQGLPAAAADGIWREETLFRRRDQSHFVTSQVVVAHRAVDGSLAYFSTIARDLSQRLTAEQALRASEARNRALVDSAPEAILVFEIESGRFVDLNDNACRLTGLTRDELLACGFKQISAAEQPGGFASGALLDARIDRALTGDDLAFEWQICTADGTILPCDIRLARLPSANRRLVRASLNDITQRKRAELALRESELRFQGIFNQTSGFIAVMSRDGTVVDINDPGLKAAGVHRRDIIGTPFWDAPWFLGGNKLAKQLKRLIGTAAEGESSPFQLDYLAGDGSRRSVLGTISPIQNPSGDLSMIIAEAYDVTERMQAERKLQDYATRLRALSAQLLETQENERRHIARELHDEIGQALTALKINLHTAASYFGADADPTGELFSDSLEITENVLSQVRDLSLDLRPSMLDDLGLVAALRWYVSKQSQRTGFPIELKVSALLPRLSSQVETACYRIVQEAVTNVMRHARARQVTVEVALADDTLTARVGDDGIGFDVDGLQVRAQLGGSFGLLGMQERVQLVGGRMQILSAPGQGTQVIASFPAQTEVASNNPAEGVA